MFKAESIGTDAFTDDFYQTSNEEITPILYILLYKVEVIFSKPFYEANALVPKPGKNITRQENNRVISEIKINAKSSKNITNQIQQYKWNLC